MQSCRADLGGCKTHRLCRRAFTLIELLIVITIIIVLAGLIIGTSGYVQNKGKRSRAEAEIAAMSAALESYKADNGIYPTSTDVDPHNNLDPSVAPALNQYGAASRILYGALSGDTNGDRVVDATEASGSKSYFTFKPGMLLPTAPGSVTAIRDPFGNSYGYSTAGYNPTFDLWSTEGAKKSSETPEQYQQRWIKNW